jgi:hypothetical protein
VTARYLPVFERNVRAETKFNLVEIHPDAVVDDGGTAASDINFDPQLGGKLFGRSPSIKGI